MKIFKKFLTLNLILLCFSNAVAKDLYICQISQINSLSKNGILEQPSWAEYFKGKGFSVDKISGKIIEENGIKNSNGDYGQPKVLDKGSSKQAFKALTVFSPFTSIAYLEVREFEEGMNKPFLLFQLGDIYSGTCRNSSN